jgi:hypothetical protein
MFFDSENGESTPTKANTIPALWSAKNIPHSANFPDPYELIGDAYTRIAVANEWELGT